MMFEVKGRFRMGRNHTTFRKHVEADSEKLAVEKAYSLIGSEHRVGRRDIEVEEVRGLES